MAHEFNVLALVKGQERYIFVYDDDSGSQLIKAFRDQASNPNLSLTWFDAVVLTNKAKEQQEAGAACEAESESATGEPHFDLQARSRLLQE